MARAPFQILVFPYRIVKGKIEYALFKRKDDYNWQGIAGGGEDKETPLETAQREVMEEAGINEDNFTQLSSIASIPVVNISGFIWGKDVLVVPEYAFGLVVVAQNIKISHEHTECQWLSYEDAMEKLAWDSNRNALWELNYRLTHSMI